MDYWSRIFNWDKYGFHIDGDHVNQEIVKDVIHSDNSLQYDEVLRILSSTSSLSIANMENN